MFNKRIQTAREQHNLEEEDTSSHSNRIKITNFMQRKAYGKSDQSDQIIPTVYTVADKN